MPTTAPESLSHGSRLPPSVLIGWLLAVSACAPLESARLLQLANSPAGLLAWFSAWNLDTSLPLLVLATLPLLLFLFRDPARQVPRTPSPPPLNP
ncbi:MAG: hypothetical protein RL215_3426, partial [Planctomycetota bacterium]